MDDLRDLKRLKRIKATCIRCGTVYHFGRDQCAPIWNRIDKNGVFPATWDMCCRVCTDEERTTQFLDWPDKREKAS